MGSLGRVLEQLKLFYGGLSRGKKIAGFLLIGMVVGGMSLIISMGNNTNYRVLYSDLPAADASNVIDRLKQMKVPYRLASNNTLMVPSDMVDECRLDLAGQGLPKGGSIGFEIFDNNKLGMGEYLQKLNYRRALQGELARTISSFNEVKYARVHIVIPERPLFAEDEIPPSASVVLEQTEGSKLDETQVRSILNLVANSVEGLDTERITIVNTEGDMLFAGQSESASKLASEAHGELRYQVEKGIETKIKAILDKALGPGKSMVKVSAEVEIKDLKQTSEKFDPDAAAVRSEQRSSESDINSEPSAEGVPGVKPNVIGLEDTEGRTTLSQHTKKDETVNYEVSKVIEDFVEPVREIKRISVAVLLDGSYKTVVDENKEETEQYVPRSEEELAKFRALVEKAMGFSKIRGDQLEIVNLPFEQMKIAKEDRKLFESFESRRFWAPYIKYGVMAALVFLTFLLVVRPLLRQIVGGSEEISGKEEQGPDVPQIEDHTRGEGVPELEAAEPTLEQRLIEMAQKNPETFAQGIRSWINESQFDSPQ